MQTLEFPYAGTSGWAGSETSRQRAKQQDTDGTTINRQSLTIGYLAGTQEFGVTWKELSESFDWHHGQASGVLSVLHKGGMIERLKHTRNKCSVYVLPEYVSGRVTEPHGNTKANSNQKALDAIRELHSKIEYSEIAKKSYCQECQYEYPCDTIKLVDQDA